MTARQVLLIGGARSGKSALAVQLALTWSTPITYVATATAGDDDMAARISRHRHERPAQWHTLEAATDLAAAVRAIDPGHGLVIDCLTMWVANEMLSGRRPEDVVAAARAVAGLVAERSSPLVVVTNEVGSGVVPATESGRDYRDLLGRVNRCFADTLDETVLVVSGRVHRLDRPDVIFPELNEPS